MHIYVYVYLEKIEYMLIIYVQNENNSSLQFLPFPLFQIIQLTFKYSYFCVRLSYLNIFLCI